MRRTVQNGGRHHDGFNDEKRCRAAKPVRTDVTAGVSHYAKRAPWEIAEGTEETGSTPFPPYNSVSLQLQQASAAKT